jgi:hypothetical protein
MEIKTTRKFCPDWDELMDQPIDVKLSLVDHHLSLAQIYDNSLFKEEVNALCGERYSLDKSGERSFSRWGYKRGSILVGILPH